MPGQAFWKASENAHVVRHVDESGQWKRSVGSPELRAIALNDEIRVEGGRKGREEYILAPLFTKLVTHVLGGFLELAFIIKMA
jgi:hypothetical protein